jgi:hypothetical protein
VIGVGALSSGVIGVGALSSGALGSSGVVHPPHYPRMIAVRQPWR